MECKICHKLPLATAAVGIVKGCLSHRGDFILMELPLARGIEHVLLQAQWQWLLVKGREMTSAWWPHGGLFTTSFRQSMSSCLKRKYIQVE